LWAAVLFQPISPLIDFFRAGVNKTRAGQFTAMWGATEASPTGPLEGLGLS
jgi:hypothetical protein